MYSTAPNASSRARSQLAELCARNARIIVAPDRDADGLAACVITIRAIERLGGTPIIELPNKGEHVHTPSMQARLSRLRADGLVVLDMGSRAGAIVEGLPTIVIDHHDARYRPDGAIFVSEPAPATGQLAFDVWSPLVDLEDQRWLVALALAGDAGMIPDGPYKKTHIKKLVPLINAARRSASCQPKLAFDLLLAANGPEEALRHANIAALEACREEVKAEVDRVGRVAPKIAGNVALIRFSSGAQVHPLVATRWAPRLAPKIVIVANDAYLPDRVNFAMRSASKTDLLAFLRELPLGRVEGEFANGHARATGGSIPPSDFARLVTALGF
jgi:single-stranded DNA-specific DHH superfamily exonuclease